MPEGVAPNIRNKSFSILAEVTVEKPDASGVIASQGSRFGGHTLFIKDKKRNCAYNFLGITEQRITSQDPVPTGVPKILVEFNKTGEDPKFVAKAARLAPGWFMKAPLDRSTELGAVSKSANRAQFVGCQH